MPHMFSPNYSIEEAAMCIEKLVRNFGFALAAGAVIIGVGFTFEYLPVLNALAH
jgi:hypothetical protein